jgi:tetratricopeptide (TPR) repeat protein
MKMNLAHNLVYIGHYKDAMSNYKDSLEILNSLNDYASAGLIYRHQGIVYLNQENWKQAQKSFKTALKLHHKAEHRPAVEATTLFLGQAYLYATEYDAAEKYILRALKLTTRRKDSLYDASARAIYFLLLAEQDKLDTEKFEQFVNEIESFINDNQRIARETWYISQIYLILNNEERALYFQKLAQKQLKLIAISILDEKIRDDYINLPLIHKKMFEPLKQYDPPVQKTEEIEKVKNEADVPNVFAFCPSCGTPNKNKFKFCPSCGNSLINN